MHLGSFWDYVFSVVNINPLHKFINSDNTVGVYEGMNSLRRLILASLAYQTVVASRRYSPNKK